MVRMRPRVGSASTYAYDSRRQGWRYIVRGAAITLLLASIVVIMVFGAASASATMRSQTKDTAADALKRPASVRALHAPARTAGSDDDIPGVAIPSSPLTGSLSATSDIDDVFSIALTAGQTFTASLTGPTGSDFWLCLYASGTASVKDFNAPFVASVYLGNYPRSFSYTPTQSGTYYLDVFAYSGAGNYTVTYSGPTPTPTPTPTGGTTELILSANHLTVPYNGTVTLTGALSDANSGSLLPNRDVEWDYSQSANPLTDLLIGGTLTSSSGEFSWKDGPIVRRTSYMLYFAGDSQYKSSVSDFVTIMPKAKLTPPAVPSRVRANTLITSWGTLQPMHTPAQNKASHTKVYWYRKIGKRWNLQYAGFATKYRSTSSATKYAVSMRCVAGKWAVGAVHQDSDHAKTTSSWRYFTAY